MALLSSSNSVDVHVSTTADNKGIDDSKRSIGGLSDTVGHSIGMFGKMTGAVALGNLAASALSKGMDMVTGSIGDAISRVDTLNNATRTFTNMGFNGKQITTTMADIKTSILGLPTALNDAVSSVQMFAASTNDLPKSQKIFAALNDGIIGFGGTAAQVQTAVIQLSQSFANGKIQAADWNSMMNAGLGPALNAIAKQMHTTTGALKDGLSDGSISVSKFQDALITLDTKGGGGLASLHKIAMDSTAGIGTGMANMRTAVTRGMADIIVAIGPERISGAITKIGALFEVGLKKVAGIIKLVLPPLISGIKDIWSLLTTGFTQDEAFGGDKAFLPVVHALQDMHVVLRLLFDTFTGGDPTLKKGEQGFAGIAKVLSGLQYIFMVVAAAAKNFFGAAIVTVMENVKFLIPPLMSLWNNISTNLIPALVRFWEVIAPLLIPALKVLGVIIGATIVAAVYLLIQGLNFLVSTFTFLYNVASSVVTGIVAGFNGLVAGLAWLKNNWIEAIGFMIGFFLTLPIKVVNAMWAAINGIIGAVASINWGGVANRIGGAFVGMWDWVKSAAIGAFNYMMGINWGALLTNVGRGFGNSIMSLIQGALNGALAGLPGSPKINLPRFAQGGVFDSATAGIFGEDGPEAIVPLSKPQRAREVMAQAGLLGGNKTEVTIGTVVLGSADAVDRFFSKLDQDATNLGKGLSPARRAA